MFVAGNKRTGIYVRVSTLEQSTELQRKELEAFVRARGWNLAYVYEDKQTGTTNNRTALKCLLDDARSRKIDIVVVWKLDRFFRSLKDLVVTLQELNDLGVAFISLKDQIDLTTASGRLLTQMIGAFAEFEAALIRERVISGLQNAKRKGKRLGRPRTVVETNKITEMASQGLSQRQIADSLGVGKGSVQRVLAAGPKTL